MKIGIIGGSGLDDPNLLQDFSDKEVETPYGKPSSVLTYGKISNVEVYILARHGKDHSILPSDVNYKANIHALKEQGCNYILATTAVGSLREDIKPGNIVFPAQAIDFTKQRKSTFHEGNNVIHTPMADPYDEKLRRILSTTCDELGIRYNKDATLVTIEGPRFSTRAESYMFRQIGADIINMSGCPEVFLAKEANIPYQAIAMSTDYDCWKQDEDPVTWEMIKQRMEENADKVKRLLIRGIEKIAQEPDLELREGGRVDSEYSSIKNKIRTIPDFPKPGVMFRDVTTLFKDSQGLQDTINVFYNRYKNEQIDKIAAIESRGFILGGSLAEKLECGFVPIRKKGKLPHETISQEYSLEYGTDSVEIHKDAIKSGEKVLLIDDLIATGGTAEASARLVERLGGQIHECAFVVDLPELKGKEKLLQTGKNVFTVVEFEGK